MKFGKSQESKFESSNGTYSIVTDREYFDSQITATDEETNLLINFFGRENIHVGNVRSDPDRAKQSFRLYPHGDVIELNLVFPKPRKSELRLYISTKAGFKPRPEYVWFIFVKDAEIWIGTMDEQSWRSENRLLLYDEADAQYQDSIDEHSQIRITSLAARDIYLRDRGIALRRLELSGYSCEYDAGHSLFISRATGKPYLEAHHLIPMSLQNTSDISLDNIHNIFCLCPSCHRAIHHAEKITTKNIVETLIHKRPEVLNILNNSASDIYNMYAVEDIFSN